MINREREISSASLALSPSSIFWAGVVVREILSYWDLLTQMIH